MISPMIKYTFLLFHADEQLFLQRIGETGVVDITVGEYTPNDEELAAVANISATKGVVDSITNYGLKRDISPATSCPLTAEEYQSAFAENWSKLDTLKGNLARLERERESAAVWGTFDITAIERLKGEGITLRWFSMASKDFTAAIEAEYPFAKIATSGGVTYFIALVKEGDEELTLPEVSLTEYRPLERDVRGTEAEIKETEAAITTTEGELDKLYSYIPAINAMVEDMTLSLRKYRIECGNRREAENNLIIVEGWCPKENSSELDSVVGDMDSVIVLSDKAIPEDNPPIKLKNNKLFSPVEMITNLFSLPNYGEIDMTPFFAPFFIFFVGMCLGDFIYGAVCLVGALAAYFKVGKSMRPAMILVMWCSFAAMVMGAITGVYGGIDVEATKLLTNEQMFPFAIGVGLLQILYAMVLQSYFRVKRFGFIYGLSQIGWTISLITLLAANLLPMAGYDSFTMDSPLFMPILGVGLFFTIFFQNPKANPFSNLGAGIWFLYNAVTGLLSDTLSYVRLFALGLSGGIIAGVFNTLATDLTQDMPIGINFLVMIIILALGHGINLFMSAISAFVHPLRLTFVEFYKNVGFEGGGRAYNPFTNKR